MSYHWRFFGTLVSLAAVAAAAPALGDSSARPIFEQHGKASYYGARFDHKRTASGAAFDRNGLTAASPTLPIGTMAKVTNVATGTSVAVRVIDRGPHKRGRIIDVSEKAAKVLDMKKDGVARVKVEATASDQPTQALRNEIAARANLQKLARAE